MHFTLVVSVLAAAAHASQLLFNVRAIHGRKTDWSVSIVESTISRFTPETIDGWGYIVSLYLLGQYKVYKRTGDPRYLSYIQDWADRFVDNEGHIDITFDSLDSMQPGNILLLLHKETNEPKYLTAATKIRNRLDTYPRNEDGAFWHFVTLEHQLWADGAFMVNPFLARYGAAYNKTGYADDETTHQLIAYANHLQDDTGLLQHAFDDSRTADWADSKTGLSPEKWCRAIGWYGMALTDILEIIPENHPNRPHIIDILEKFVQGVKRYQDPKTGRWFQVVDKGDLSDNWTETSCSAMFTHTVSKSLEKGYIDDPYRRYKTVVEKGYQGVLGRIQKNVEGLTDVSEICVGTNVGDLQWYLERPRQTNDFHGLGAVLLMNEQVAYGGQ